MIGRASLCVVAAACMTAAAADNPPAAKAELAGNIGIAHCLDVLTRGIARKPAVCPGFLMAPLKYALAACHDAGGKLVPLAPANIWTLDLNGDHKKEYGLEYEGNVSCDGAPSVFSCGSLGCPVTLYENFQGGWRAIGQVSSGGIHAIELLTSRAPGGYRDLRVGCGTGDTCAEFAYLHWTGATYEAQWLEVRGFKVTFSDAASGLYALAGETAVLATPSPDATVLAHYGPDTEVALIGAAGAYYYVSPCNACESGFVPKATVQAIKH
ncbi:MAG TPA: hypothetical protein VE046_12860 [Steroidobacteraceae bacterium]|nr:hypothetical protein [Steroidobacteraceae bacterium]